MDYIKLFNFKSKCFFFTCVLVFACQLYLSLWLSANEDSLNTVDYYKKERWVESLDRKDNGSEEMWVEKTEGYLNLNQIDSGYREMSSEKTEGYLINETNLQVMKQNKSLIISTPVPSIPRAVNDLNSFCPNSSKGDLHLWNISKPVVNLHIGKSGGTSMDVCVSSVVKRHHGKYIGGTHFDWSGVEKLKNPEVVVLLRDPVSRAVSHFYFSRLLRWTKALAIRNQTLSEYLHDCQSMLDTRDIWQDGQASIMWLTGTHIASWVRVPVEEVPHRERMFLGTRSICLLAACRLEETLWFGFMDDLDRSLELLTYQLDHYRPIRFIHGNRNAYNKTITDSDKDILKSLMPLDMWLYSYAKLLFEARWNKFKTGVYIKPGLPPIPEPSCISTRFAIKCTAGPLSPLYFRGTAPEGHQYII